MRVKLPKTEGAVSAHGFRERRLVVSARNSIEPMTASLPFADIRQIAVLAPDPTDEARRFTVAAQVGPERWVRLGVFDSMLAAEELIQSCAQAMSESRYVKVWKTMLLAGLLGFVYLVIAMAVSPSGNGPVTAAMDTMVAPAPQGAAAALAPVAQPEQPVAAEAAAPAPQQGAAATMPLNKAQEAEMKAFFGGKN